MQEQPADANVSSKSRNTATIQQILDASEIAMRRLPMSRRMEIEVTDDAYVWGMDENFDPGLYPYEGLQGVPCLVLTHMRQHTGLQDRDHQRDPE